MTRYIDTNKDRYRVEPICAHLPIAPTLNNPEARRVMSRPSSEEGS